MYHAVIQCDSDGVVLLDKGSLNKTKLNKVVIKMSTISRVLLTLSMRSLEKSQERCGLFP